MSVLRVTCVTKDQTDEESAITGVGGESFYHTAEDAAEFIGNRTHQYWTEVDGESVWLEVARTADRKAYLKTEKDDSSPDHLLALEECENLPDEGSSSEDAFGAAPSGQETIADRAARLALRTVVRMLVLNRYGRDEARLLRNRDDALRRVSAAVENMSLDEVAKDQMNEALTRELHFFFASPPKP